MSNPSTLYGAPRPKNKPIPLSSSSIHALSTELAAARSALSRTENPAPARARARTNGSSATSKTAALTGAGEGEGPSEGELQRSRKSLLLKARRYRALQRGGESADALVDFDRKWGEEGSADSSSDDDGDGGDDDGVMVEYEDEFGRTRTGTRGEAEREKRRMEVARVVQESVNDGAGAGARPLPPQGVIYGNNIQTRAFHTPLFSSVPTSEEMLAARAEREEVQGDVETHYDASKEVRTKGVGFFQFSKDVEVRREEMEELEKERQRTQAERMEKEGRRKRKREELEKRREQIKAKRRVKVGGSWLDDQFGDLLGGDGEGAA
ncbi:hypothetical protein BZA05DRAFT_427938 [Tricharina praecox]|uniref:uncharacterized protein n=1 Tax=Tricharina praecox TaxID=43433 RepID=UPI00221F7B74|nr:uncharacterized protein BZA05DRAFT_427938 [Tricharina praecox]KAI5858588.1 hypothetical protein BZA05DRAFT_427938 [Tricharina praecox]